MKFDFTFSDSQTAANPSPEDDTPMKILVLGNFSGGIEAAGTQPRLPLRKRPAIKIDRDCFDQVMNRLAPRLQTESEDIEFHELEDFRPEQLAKKLKTLSRLKELRQKLLNPATFAQAAEELRQSLLVVQSVPQHEEKPKEKKEEAFEPPADSPEDGASLLKQILSNTREQQPQARRSIDPTESAVQRMIDEVIAPYIVPKADPRQDVYLAAIDKAMAENIRRVLHLSGFQSLEASWRSLRKLVSTIEDDLTVQIHLLDVTFEELLAEVPTNDEQLHQWSLFRRLSEDINQGMGTVPWAFILGDFRFGATPNEVGLLSALAATAQSLQTPFIASAQSSLLGCPSLVKRPDPDDWQKLDSETTECWGSLRRSSAAAWVGLTAQRVLLRMPYGKDTNKVQSFAFEEFLEEHHHEDFLWGNAAYLCGGLIIQSFSSQGWSMQLPNQIDIDDLPAYAYSEDGEDKLLACGEVAFGEHTAIAILQQGMMPLLSWRDRNAVRFIRFQSIADPLTALSGPWS